MRLKDKVALITGSSRGIGRATALTFAREGANIVVNYASNQEVAMETYEKIKAMGREVILEKADVSSQAQVDGMVKNTLSRFNRIDILVNNAGGTAPRTAMPPPAMENVAKRLSGEFWPSVMALNLYGPMNCVRAVVQPMLSRKYGKIINIASLAGLVIASKYSHPGYVAAKAALLALTKKLAIELGPYGINVNAVVPGPTNTGRLRVGRTEEEYERVLSEHAKLNVFGGIGEPQDVANAVLFFASDESSFITGQIVNVDGGRFDFFSHT
jgi:3-oxoacyl-[acyl-carrier protein] reductase